MLRPDKSNNAHMLLERLAKKRRDLLGQYPLVPPERNALIGARVIMKYMGIRSTRTLYRMIHEYGLPVVPRSDGVLFSTVTSIDDWLFLAAEANHNARKQRERARRARAKVKRQQKNGSSTDAEGASGSDIDMGG